MADRTGANEDTVKRFLVSGAKEGMSKEAASAAIKGIMAGSHVYEGETPIDKVVSDNWESAKATAEAQKAVDKKDAKRAWRGGDAF